MDVREKMVELLDEAEEWANHKCDELDCETCPARKMKGNCFQQLMVGRLIANGVTVHEWIPVMERLPSKEEYATEAEDGIEYYVRLLIAYKTDIVEYEIGYYDGYKWMTEMPIRLIKDVVAWMPFPNMPLPEPLEDGTA